jgi:hypothetical protein
MHEIFLNRILCFFSRETEAARHSQYMRIHGNPLLYAERGGENDGCCFSTNAAQSADLIHRPRNLPVEIFENGLATFVNRACLHAKCPARTNIPFQFSERNAHVIFRDTVLPKKRTCHDVHALIRALRGKNGGNEQVEGTTPFEGAAGIGIETLEFPENEIDRGGMKRSQKNRGKGCKPRLVLNYQLSIINYQLFSIRARPSSHHRLRRRNNRA